jgi:hypothetical protein
MLATMRDHAMQGMMVLLVRGVECFAKIAMRTLPSQFAAMRLLPKQDRPRLIFLDARATRIH